MSGRRIGFYSLRKVGRELCRLIYVFTPIIRKAYPDNAVLLAALETANVACDALVKEIDEVAEPGV